MAKKKRTLKILCLKHPHLIDRIDGGSDREGNDSSERGQTRALFKKRVKVDGVDGVGLPMYMLAEEPDRLHPDDPFDGDVLCDRATGKFLVATPEWLAAREKLLGVHRARAEKAKAKANELLKAQITKGVEALAASLTTPAPPAATVAAEKGGRGGKGGKNEAKGGEPKGENSEES